MSIRCKLGLTRSRVFALENCVYFSGVIDNIDDNAQFEKSLTMLREKYPLLGCALELCSGGEVFVTEIADKVSFDSLSGDVGKIISDLRREGLDFSKELFRVVLINGNVLALFGHTAVCDVCSLALLAAELMRFYRRESFDIERREPELFSSKSDLPDNAASVVIERIANSLNFAWIKHDRFFEYCDYVKAVQAYSAKRPAQHTVAASLTAAETASLISRCSSKKADISAAAAYCVFEQLTERGYVKKDRHVLWQCNERLFLPEDAVWGVGPYNSAAAVKVRRGIKKGLTPFDDFQNETYRKHATCFSVFYDNVYLMEILPQLCDAANLCEAGTFKNRTAESLAEKSFNMCGSALGCGFFNFDQRYWESIKCFKSFSFSEPFSRRTQYYLNISLYNGELNFELSYREGELSGENAASVLANAVRLLKEMP